MKEVYFSFGCSGCGKSTRVYQLIKFLESEGVRQESFKFKGKTVGILFPDPNIMIIGTEVTSKGIRKWQGLDSFTGVFGSAEGIIRFIEETSRKHIMVVEGSGILLSNRYRPEYLYKETKIRKTHGRIYAFKDFTEYQERIRGRSGYTIESEAMWTKNKGFILYMDKYKAELATLGNPQDASYEIELSTWDAPVTDLGDIVLKDLFQNFEEIADKFHMWSEEHNYAKQFVLSRPNLIQRGFF